MKERLVVVMRVELMVALADLEGAGKGAGWTDGRAVAVAMVCLGVTRCSMVNVEVSK